MNYFIYGILILASLILFIVGYIERRDIKNQKIELENKQKNKLTHSPIEWADWK